MWIRIMSLSTSVMKEKTSHHTSQMHLWSLFLYVFVPVCILNTDTDACSSKPGENCKNLRDSRFLCVFMPVFFFCLFVLMIQFQLLHCPLICLCVAFCQANLCLLGDELHKTACIRVHESFQMLETEQTHQVFGWVLHTNTSTQCLCNIQRSTC